MDGGGGRTRIVVGDAEEADMRLSAQRLFNAFAVGSTVYFWYQFSALSDIESQIQRSLTTVGLQNVLQPSATTVSRQQQAPFVAGAAALAVLFLA